MARGAKPGERRGGRSKGTPNKATADIKAIARQHGPEVIEGFVRLFRDGESEQARIAAGKEILDRAYGKATQPIAGDDTADPIRMINEIVLRGVRPNAND